MNWKVRTASFLLCLGILLVTIQDGTAEKKIVCYYTNWSVYRPGTAKFSPQNINPYLCTHLIYAFGGFTKDNAMKPFDKYQDIEKGGYAKFTGLKTYNKNLKTMLAIGGWNEGSSRFSPMVADAARRKEFVKNAIKFLRQNHFDGLDLDWEYPAYRDGGKPRDKNNYADLVQELRAEFDRESSKTGRPRLLLTMAIPAGLEYIEKGYDLSRLNEYLDFFNLLSYDYHSAYEPAVNHHSPLYPLEEDNEYNYDNELTVDYTINELLKKGASAEKIVLGIPTYGRSYTLFNEDATDIGSPADGPGVEGDATREKGYLAYYEICESLAESDEWEVVQPNPTAMGPYAFKGNQWVGYDDEDIVRLKAKYVNERSLGGIMFWSIDNDDFRGKCHGRPYPLIEAAKEALLVTETKNSPGQKTISTFNRKKNNRGNTGIQSNVIGRKFGRSSTTSTTEEPTQRKRVSSARKKLRSRQRGNEDDEEKEVESRSFASRDDDSEALSGNAVRSVEKGQAKPRSRGKSRNRSSSGRRKPSKRREENRQDSAEEEESLSVKLTTPEPPTTPDPGSDFKCEDEGFFPHPRDCKKYFWCLDSGPGGLGVVAHQFTCPSGLVFNKAADSCDYPRNVICPKVKSSQSTVSTTRAPITAATSRTTYLHSTTRRTTTSKPESEEEYEYYEDEEETEEEDEDEEEEAKPEPKITTTSKPLQYKTINRSRPTSTTTTTSTTPSPKTQTTDGERSLDIDEEDPKVIKELINLIKKAGGIEQLEKQLLFQDKSSAGETSGSEKVTPATISRSLYERVLSRQAGKAIAGNRQAVSPTSRTISYANGPGGAQFEGLDEVPEVKSLRRTNRPQYVTIERPKPSTTESALEDEEELADEEAEEDNEDVASSEEENISDPVEKSTQSYRITPSYVNIRRSRPTTTTSRSENDVIEKDEVVDDEPTVRRRRPLNPRTVENEEDSPRAEASEGESVQKSRTAEETRTTKSRYVGIQRFRSTTPRSVDNDLISTRRSTSTRKIDEASEEESTTLTLTSSTSSSSPKVSSTSASLSALNVDETSDTIGTLSSGTSGIYSDGTVNYDVTTSLSGISSTTVSGDYASIASTDSTVKLVEDSATEILLTTVQGLTGSTGSSSTTLRSSTVSQPRPFGFTRRRLVGSAVPPAVTSSTESTRSKVSTGPRKPPARGSFPLGRARTRTTTEPSIRASSEIIEEEIKVEGPKNRPGQRGSAFRGSGRYTTLSDRSNIGQSILHENQNRTVVQEKTFPYRGQSRGRPSSRTTVETVETSTESNMEEVSKNFRYRSRNRGTTKAIGTASNDESSTNSVYKYRGRTTQSILQVASTEGSVNNPRRRYGKLSRTSTEASTVNEVEDSPIVRISQTQPARSQVYRGRNSNFNDENSHKVTNIKVFQRPGTVNREIYGRTKPTTNDDVNFVSATVSVDSAKDDSQETRSYFYVTTPTFENQENIKNYTENDSANSVDEEDEGLILRTTMPYENDVEIETTTVSYTDSLTTELNVSNSMEEISENPIATTAKINVSETITNDVGTVGPRKRKVLIRKRPVSTTESAVTKYLSDEKEKEIQSSDNSTIDKVDSIDENTNRPVIRRRKIIRRLRPVQNRSTEVTSAMEFTTKAINNFTPSSSYEEINPETVKADDFTTDFSTVSTNPTVSLDENTVYDFATTDSNIEKMTMENEFTDLASTAITESLDTIATSTEDYENRYTTSIPLVIDEETVVPTSTTENVPSAISAQENAVENSTKSLAHDDDYFSGRNSIVTENLIGTTESTVRVNFPLTTASTSGFLLSTNNFESRNVRRKFVRKRPLTSYGGTTSTTERNTAQALSKRRKNLYVRRRPVSSTTTRTTQTLDDDFQEYEEQGEDENPVESEEIPEATTLKIPVDDNSPGASNSFINNDSQQFWKRYTTEASSSGKDEIFKAFAIPQSTNSFEETSKATTVEENSRGERQFGSAFAGRRRYSQNPGFQSSTEISRPQEGRSRFSGFRQPRTRQGATDDRAEDRTEVEEEKLNKSPLPSRSRFYVSRSSNRPAGSDENLPLNKVYSAQTTRSKYQSRRPVVTTTELSVTETLIPAKKFDFAADALHRRQQTIRPTQRYEEDETTTYPVTEKIDFPNFVDEEFALTTSKPLITRLVTSIAESATTERQKILIKTKYSSLTSNTRIPIRGLQKHLEQPSTTETTDFVASTLEKTTDDALDEDSILNEIQPGLERSTLSIEGEFANRNGNERLTTESYESSTIEIESVFSNLISNSKEIAK